MDTAKWKKAGWAIGALFVVVAAVAGAFLYALLPADAQSTIPTTFEISKGEGFRAVADGLAAVHLIRSAAAFDAYALLGGRALAIKPGLYRLDPAMSAGKIVDIITTGGADEATVTIPEGSNIYQVDAILSAALVIKPGALVDLQASGTQGDLEGRLFPDTYRFYTGSNATSVVKEMEDNFEAKAGPLFAAAGIDASATAGQAMPSAEEKILILASILEKEVPDRQDREIVAGILLKREKSGMPLDVDATVCYAKLTQENMSQNGAPTSGNMPDPLATSCPTLTPLDFKIKSPYNTYLYGGLPPGPIGNPGTSSIVAALHPQSSPYWYYLSDPATGKTIFAKTLDEQTANRVKYLESNR